MQAVQIANAESDALRATAHSALHEEQVCLLCTRSLCVRAMSTLPADCAVFFIFEEAFKWEQFIEALLFYVIGFALLLRIHSHRPRAAQCRRPCSASSSSVSVICELYLLGTLSQVEGLVSLYSLAIWNFVCFSSTTQNPTFFYQHICTQPFSPPQIPSARSTRPRTSSCAAKGTP